MDPLLYHAHTSQNTEDIPFWLQIIASHGGPILELGCGTGRVTQALADAGYDIIGLDNDESMLTIINKRLTSETRSRIKVVQGDMADYCFGTRFRTIICPCNTLSTLSTNKLERTIKNALLYLQQGGAFAASLPNPELLNSLPMFGEEEIEDIFPHPLDSEPVQVSSSWIRENNIITIKWFYDHLLPDGEVERSSIQARHTILSAIEYNQIMSNLGYSIITLYGDFNFQPYTKDAPYLILVATC